MNVLVLAVDSLRRDYCYGDETETPAVDRLREEGVTFDQAISGATWTPPSMSSIFSGVYPHRLGMYDFDAPYPEDLKSVFGYFDEAGYEVGSFVFDEENLFSNVPEANVVDNFRDYEQSRDWIRDNSEEDFFLFLHHYWVHGPYEPQDSAEAWSEENEKILQGLREDHGNSVQRYREKYADAVEEMSENWLAGILSTLEDEGILDETLIVFTGDHGESWGERYEDKSDIQTNFHLHGKLLYDELVRVPLVVRYPDTVPQGELIEEQVRHVDVFPTLMDIASLEWDDDWERDGETLTPAFDGGRIEHRIAISSATDVELEKLDKLSVRDAEKGWKLIWTLSENQLELYDIDENPDESENKADEEPEETDRLKQILDREIERKAEYRESTEFAEDRLKDLGYL